MSGQPQNLEIGYQGSNIFLDIKFYDGNSESLVDPDAIPTYQIYDPNNTLIVSGQGTKLSLGYWQAVFFIPISAPLGYWKIVWSATVFTIPVANNVEIFSVKAAGDSPQTSIVTIDDQWLRQVKRVLAFPGIDNILLDDPQIKEFAVWPAVYEYFRKFPKKDRQEYAIDGELIIPYPDDHIIGVTDLRIADKFGTSSTAGGGISAFWDIVRYQSLYGGNLRFSGKSGGAYGTRYNPNGIRQQFLFQRQVAETFSNMYGTYKLSINKEQKQIEAYANTQAKVVVTWARYSTDFKDIPYSYLHNVIELAQYFLLMHLSDSQALLDDQQLDKKINHEALKTRAQVTTTFA
jgi:hypothetical protein